ncbi:hypothetical protein LCGC14_0668190 [marine sediment metagenome]|uniref:DNA2/NAM7 helicase helicase domain-containing protein n=1 Tax=marine sediment metagenome TaxID=412755 RepID=A0A0F9QWT3_9ZZZZ
MIKLSNAVIPDKLTDNKFILVKNTCYINNFTLRIFSNPENSTTIYKNAFPIKNLKYDLRSRSNKINHTSTQIINLDGRVSLDKPITPEEGNMDLQWTDKNNNLILIKLQFELTNDKNQAYDFELFFIEINEIFQKYLDLNESSKKQRKLDHFLKPHIIGVRNFISLLNTPLEISYEIKENQIKLFGYEEGELHNYIRNQQIDFEGEISINTTLDNRRMTLYWNDDENHWYFEEEFMNKIPKKGFFFITPKRDLNKNHDEIRSNHSHECLVRINIDPDCEGSKILRKLFSQDVVKIRDIDLKPLVKESIVDTHLGIRYERLSSKQKEIIENFHKKSIIVLNGEAGTGKTEVAALISLISAMTGERVLISSEKNEAINNLYKRIINMMHESQKIKKLINITRFKAKSHVLHDRILSQYEADNQINLIKDMVKKKCTKTSDNDSIDALKKKFMETFTKKEILTRLISLTYDIIISTFGNICQKKALSEMHLKYDLNIIEASSSVNLSQASIGTHNSRRWLLLNDEEQVDPLTPDSFLLKQPLIFPEKDDIQSAKKYDPLDRSMKKSKIKWGNLEYKKSVANLFNDFDDNAYLHHYCLQDQFRIHPKLYKFLCKVFDRDYNLPKGEQILGSHLNKITDLFSSKNHLKYEVMKAEEILSQMGKKISQLVELIKSKKLDSNNLITIGVACTDVQSLIKVINAYQLERKGQIIPSKKPTFYPDEDRGFKIVFSSIENHQEHEYDLFILGVINYRSKKFKKRIYTALSRACNFAMIYGPLIKSSGNYISQNMKILKKLQERGC